jgi:hypothetical protein
VAAAPIIGTYAENAYTALIGTSGFGFALPVSDAVYDLRAPRTAGGWPYGVAGPSGRLYRCGRLPVFAVAGLPAEGWRAPYPRPRVAPTPGSPASAELSFAIETPKGVRMRRSNPENPGRQTLSRQTSGRVRRLPIQDAQPGVLEVRRCA